MMGERNHERQPTSGADPYRVWSNLVTSDRGDGADAPRMSVDEEALGRRLVLWPVWNIFGATVVQLLVVYFILELFRVSAPQAAPDPVALWLASLVVAVEAVIVYLQQGRRSWTALTSTHADNGVVVLTKPAHQGAARAPSGARFINYLLSLEYRDTQRQARWMGAALAIELGACIVFPALWMAVCVIGTWPLAYAIAAGLSLLYLRPFPLSNVQPALRRSFWTMLAYTVAHYALAAAGAGLAPLGAGGREGPI